MDDHSTYVVRMLRADGTLTAVFQSRCVCGYRSEELSTEQEADADADAHGPPMVPNRRRSPIA